MENDESLNPKTHSCLTCGYTWSHGKNGDHNCASFLKDKLDKCATDEWLEISTIPIGEMVLLACADWQFSNLFGKPIPIKVGYLCKERNEFIIFGASWTPTHWMRLPNFPMELMKDKP